MKPVVEAVVLIPKKVVICLLNLLYKQVQFVVKKK